MDFNNFEKNSGFKGLVQEEEKTNEKVEIKNLFSELDSLMPPRAGIVHMEKNPATNEVNMDSNDFQPFIDHPERIVWLREFVSKAKEKITALLPEGVGMNVLTEKNDISTSSDKTKWVDFNTDFPKDSEAILKTASEIRTEFFKELNSFESK